MLYLLYVGHSCSSRSSSRTLVDWPWDFQGNRGALNKYRPISRSERFWICLRLYRAVAGP